VGATLVKTFSYPADLRRPGEGSRAVETRLLVRKARGWEAQTYVWNAGQTEAVLKRAGMRLTVNTVDKAGRPLAIDYAVPNTNQCKECHSQSGTLVPIGPKARNLNGMHAYAGEWKTSSSICAMQACWWGCLPRKISEDGGLGGLAAAGG